MFYASLSRVRNASNPEMEIPRRMTERKKSEKRKRDRKKERMRNAERTELERMK